MTHNGYPYVPNHPAAEQFNDPSVTIENSFKHQTMVEYDDETTLLFDQLGDEFKIGDLGHHKYADSFNWVIIRTDTARYVKDADTFARYQPSGDGSGNGELLEWDSSIVSDGMSGKIGEPITLPGASAPEIVTNVELRYKLGQPGDKRVEGLSPFAAGELMLEAARKKLDSGAEQV